MKTLQVKTVKMDGQWVITAIIKYSDNKAVKRIYNMNGELIDAKPFKNITALKQALKSIGNTNALIS